MCIRDRLQPAPALRRDADRALHQLGDRPAGRAPHRARGRPARLRRVLQRHHIGDRREALPHTRYQRVLRAEVRAAPLLPQARQGLRGGWPLAPRMVPPGQGSPAGPLPGRPPGSPSRAPNCRPKNAPQKLRRILGATICMAKLVVAKTGTKPSVPRPPCRQLAPSSDARRTTST